MKKFIVGAVATATFAAPLLAFAVTTLGQWLGIFGNLVGIATPIVVALALFAFFWGLAMYIFNTGDEKKRKSGIHIMIWGVIALFVMVSVWGIVNSLQATFGVAGGSVDIPIVNPYPRNPYGA